MFPINAHNRRLLETALGNEPADLVIRDGVLMDVYTGRMVPHQSVAVAEQWIAYVGPDADYAIGERTRVIEADGRAIAPAILIPILTSRASATSLIFWSMRFPAGPPPMSPRWRATLLPWEPEVQGLFRAGAKPACQDLLPDPPMVTASKAAAPLYITTKEAKKLLEDETCPRPG